MLGLQGAYHGDTLGAMDCVAPSPFNGRRQTPWYAGRGLFLDPPTLALRGGAWAGAGQPAPLPDLAAVFAPRPEAVAAHRAAIAAALDAHDAAAGARLAARPAPPALAACLLEPVVQGSGGMRLVDPAFQRALAAEARARGIPLVLDEVFTGLWRLGAPSGAALLGLDPDVACYGKLLTGGLVPLALTLASEPVFEAFKGRAVGWMDARVGSWGWRGRGLDPAAQECVVCEVEALGGAGARPAAGNPCRAGPASDVPSLRLDGIETFGAECAGPLPRHRPCPPSRGVPMTPASLVPD